MTCTSLVSLQQPLNPQVREERSVSAWVDQEGNAKRCGWPEVARKGGRCGNCEVKRYRPTGYSGSLGLLWLMWLLAVELGLQDRRLGQGQS